MNKLEAPDLRAARHTPAEHAKPSTRPPKRSKPPLPLKAVVAVMLGGLVFIVGMVASYTQAMANPSPNGLRIAIAGSSEVTVQLMDQPELSISTAVDAAAARSQVLSHEVEAAIVMAPDGSAVTTYVASGPSRAISSVASSIGDQVAKSAGVANTTIDLAPPAENNQNGTLEFYMVIFITIGGSFGSAIFYRVLGPIRTGADLLMRFVVLITMAGLLAAGVMLYASQVFDGLVGGHSPAIFAGLWFYTFSVASFVTGISTLGGPIAGAVVSIFFVMLGNSASGGPFGTHMQGSFFQALRWVVPQTWGLELVHDIEYFASSNMATSLTAIAIWAVAGIAATLIGMHLRSETRTDDAPQERPATGQDTTQAEDQNPRELPPGREQMAPTTLISPAVTSGPTV